MVIAQLPEDVKEENRRALRKVFGKHAYYDTLEEVLDANRRHMDKKSN
jgi:hypothetical protein